MKTISFEIDEKELSKALKEKAVNHMIDTYFLAQDIAEYDKREKVKRERLEKIMDQVDWDKLPETMKQGILSQFVSKFISGRHY